MWALVGAPSLVLALAAVPSVSPRALNPPKEVVLQAAARKAPDKLRLYTLDLAVPGSPALAVLGLAAENVTRPSSPKDIAMSLLNGVDAEGHLQTGVAIDVTPRMLIRGASLTFMNYTTRYRSRLAARTQVSYATAKGATSDDEAARMALGVHVTPWDEGDPRLDADLQKCFDNESRVLTQPISPALPQDEIDKELARRESQARLVADKCRRESRARNWAASGWSLGIAPTWTSATGAASDLGYSGIGLWTSLALGIGGAQPSSQLLLHARRRTQAVVTDPIHKGQYFKQDTTFAGARYRFGNPDVAAAVEAGWQRTTTLGGSSDTTYHLSIGAEIHLGENAWLAFTVGGDGGGDQGRKHPLSVLSTVKWGFSKTAQLADVYQP